MDLGIGARQLSGVCARRRDILSIDTQIIANVSVLVIVWVRGSGLGRRASPVVFAWAGHGGVVAIDAAQEDDVDDGCGDRIKSEDQGTGNKSYTCLVPVSKNI